MDKSLYYYLINIVNFVYCILIFLSKATKCTFKQMSVYADSSNSTVLILPRVPTALKIDLQIFLLYYSTATVWSSLHTLFVSLMYQNT